MKNHRAYFGKYRGKVENNIDLMGLGRIQVSCPAVLGEGSLSWAMPCSPYAGPGVGFFALPPSGANVWVEFEGGNPDYPIWSGCFWGVGEIPAEVPANTPLAEFVKLFKTDAVTITISDQIMDGGVSMIIESPAVLHTISLVCNPDGVSLSVGDNVSAVMTPEDITMSVAGLTGGESTAIMTPDDITLSVGDDTSAVLSADGIELTGASESTISMTSSSIEAVNGESTVAVESSGIELVNGSGKVKIESSGVKINDGAVEVM